MARDLRNPDIEIKLTRSKDNKGEDLAARIGFCMV